MASIKRKKKKQKKSIKNFVFLVTFLFASFFCYHLIQKKYAPPSSKHCIDLNLKETYILERTKKNYNQKVDSVATLLNLNKHYLTALVALECSGRKEFEPRYEKHVFSKLKKVRDGQLSNYGSIKKKTIKDASDEALKNLATSWGPFQLMGYQCIEMKLNVHEIRGKDAIYWGAVWIKKRYGKYLEAEKFEDAFHIHNTGRPHPEGSPKTHDPEYVQKGIKYMQYLQQDEEGL